MRKSRTLGFSVVFLMALFLIKSLAQEAGQARGDAQPQPDAALQADAQENRPASIAIKDKESIPDLSENITLDFTEADIRNVLKIISYKSGVNIVTTPEVIGNITIRLVDVPWEKALDVILKTYGYGYERQGNIILVTKMENISKIQAEESLKTEIFILKFLDAQDAERSIIPMLSPRGKISILYAKGQKGWQFGSFKIGKEYVSPGQLKAQDKDNFARAETVAVEKNTEGRTITTKVEFEASVKSKTIVVTDTGSSLDRIRSFIQAIDKKPAQVLIETRIIEVSREKLLDLGVDWGLGSGNNAESTAISTQATGSGSAIGGHILSTINGTAITTANPYTSGGQFVFQKLTGTKFEAIIHAIEQDSSTNTLSAPRILTIDNQEASMLVGYHTPILASTVTAGSTTTDPTVTQTLDYYQEIGIRLNVVPQISEEGYINMIIHPSVTSSTSSVTATSTAGGEKTETDYPIIDVREAQTQILMQDNETVVIGGLMKDVKTKEFSGVPLLSKIPYLGKFFSRESTNTSKVDLLIFITAHILKENETLPEQIFRPDNPVEPGMLPGAKKPSK